MKMIIVNIARMVMIVGESVGRMGMKLMNEEIIIMTMIQASSFFENSLFFVGFLVFLVFPIFVVGKLII